MKIKSICLFLLMTISVRSYSQDFGTLSGTIRVGGGLYGSLYSYVTPVTVALLQAFKFTNFDSSNWSNEQHGVFRFLNIGGDVLIPNWSMTASNADIELHRPLENYQKSGFLDGGLKNYTTYVGYYLNWRSQFSRWGIFGGFDYEWRNFVVMYPYPNMAYNKIQAIIPTVGMRYRIINPMKEVEGFPINVVLEAGISYVVNTVYKNSEDYGLNALNTGFRPVIGLAITTNRFGSLHVRWTKDLYNLFNKRYEASSGFLCNNEVKNNFSCFSIGWAIFL